MTGPEHYREAERLLSEARKHGFGGAPAHVAAAQVHATLASAAATMSTTFALVGASQLPPSDALRMWSDALQPNGVARP